MYDYNAVRLCIGFRKTPEFCVGSRILQYFAARTQYASQKTRRHTRRRAI
jgi:hypothetical protein